MAMLRVLEMWLWVVRTPAAVVLVAATSLPGALG